MRNHHQDRLHRLRQPKNLTVVLFLFLLFGSSPLFAQVKARLIVPVEGEKEFRHAFTEKVAQAIRDRVRIAKAKGLDIVWKSDATINVKSLKPLDGLTKTLLTSAGHFEIREIEANSDLFDLALSEFPKLASRRDGGIRSICSEERADLDHALSRMVGPDVHFAVYYNRSFQVWCALSLGNAVLKNDAVERVDHRKSMEGRRTLAIKIKADFVARLAENGELDVKTLGITLDGDLIARSTLAQIRRTPISIEPPASVATDAYRKRWLAVVHALVSARIPKPIVLLED